jgi:selenium metabolism protein YedF
MSFMIDARGLACPQPVILTKKALESHSDITVMVDNAAALENVKRLAVSSGCAVAVSGKDGGVFEMRLAKNPGASSSSSPVADMSARTGGGISGPAVFVISSDRMGRGDDALGELLMKAFIHTALDLDHGPDVMIFYNAGVKLAAEGSPVLEDLKILESRGVKILVCGTCVNFFELTGRIGAGTVSNMYDIAGTLSAAGRIVQP